MEIFKAIDTGISIGLLIICLMGLVGEIGKLKIKPVKRGNFLSLDQYLEKFGAFRKVKKWALSPEDFDKFVNMQIQCVIEYGDVYINRCLVHGAYDIAQDFRDLQSICRQVKENTTAHKGWEIDKDLYHKFLKMAGLV